MLKSDAKIKISDTAFAYIIRPGYFIENEGIRGQSVYVEQLHEAMDYLTAIIKNTIAKTEFSEELEHMKVVKETLVDINENFIPYNESVIRQCLFAIWEKSEDKTSIKIIPDPETSIDYSSYIKISEYIAKYAENYNRGISPETQKKLHNDLDLTLAGLDCKSPLPISFELFLAKEFKWTLDYIRSLSQKDVQGISSYYKQKHLAEEHRQTAVPQSGTSTIKQITLEDAREQLKESTERRRKMSNDNKEK